MVVAGPASETLTIAVVRFCPLHSPCGHSRDDFLRHAGLLASNFLPPFPQSGFAARPSRRSKAASVFLREHEAVSQNVPAIGNVGSNGARRDPVGCQHRVR